MPRLGGDILQGIKFELGETFKNATRRQLKLAGQHFENIVKAYRDNVMDPSARAEVNEGIALQMREAVLAAYKTNVVAVRSAPPYRAGDRSHRSGTLLSALESEPFIIGTAGDIEYDFLPLNATASHWARLNYGANPGIGRSGVQFPALSGRIQFGKNQGQSYILPGYPSPAFNVPEGPAFSGHFKPDGSFFIGYPGRDEETGKFPKKGAYPIVRGKISQHGIGARHFMDAGLVALQQNFGRAYREFFQDAVRKTKAETNS